MFKMDYTLKVKINTNILYQNKYGKYILIRIYLKIMVIENKLVLISIG